MRRSGPSGTASRTARLLVVLDSGPLFRLGSFQIEGLAAQDPETVRNLAYTKRGAPVTEALILDFQERLQKAGVTINRPPREGRMAFIRSPDNASVELLQIGEALPPAEPWLSMPNIGHW